MLKCHSWVLSCFKKKVSVYTRVQSENCNSKSGPVSCFSWWCLKAEINKFLSLFLSLPTPSHIPLYINRFFIFLFLCYWKLGLVCQIFYAEIQGKLGKINSISSSGRKASVRALSAPTDLTGLSQPAMDLPQPLPIAQDAPSAPELSCLSWGPRAQGCGWWASGDSILSIHLQIL